MNIQSKKQERSEAEPARRSEGRAETACSVSRSERFFKMDPKAINSMRTITSRRPRFRRVGLGKQQRAARCQ